MKPRPLPDPYKSAMNPPPIRLILSLMVVFCSTLFCPDTIAQTPEPYRDLSALFGWNRPLHEVAFGNGIFVAIGDYATILTSKDGIHWTNHSSDISVISTNCANINFSTETFSAGGDTVTFVLINRVSSAPDIATNSILLRHYFQNRFPRLFLSITFGHGTFVIVGTFGLILTSHDGEHWVAGDQRVPDSASYLHGVTAGDSGFVAVGQDGIILTSPDGLKWTQRDSGTALPFYSVAFGNGRYVALANHNTTSTTVFTSSDGIKWTPAGTELKQNRDIAFGNGIFLAAMTYGRFPPQLRGRTLGKWARLPTMVSTNGDSWHQVTDPIPLEGTGVFNVDFPTHVTFCGGRFIATTFGDISTSADANTWIPSTRLKSVYYGAAYGNGTFVAVGNGSVFQGTNTMRPSNMTIASSKDAISWNVSQGALSRLLWGFSINDKIFKLGYDYDLTNTNEINSLKWLLGIGNRINSQPFTTGLGGNLEATNEYSCLETVDGTTWTTPDKTAISGIVNGNIVVTYTDKIPAVLATEDGIHWTKIKPTHSDNPTQMPAPPQPAVIAGNNQYTTISDGSLRVDLNGRAYKLNLTSSIGQSMEIQATSDLQSWETLTTITNTGGTLHFIDPDAKNYPQRFYRVKLQ